MKLCGSLEGNMEIWINVLFYVRYVIIGIILLVFVGCNLWMILNCLEIFSGNNYVIVNDNSVYDLELNFNIDNVEGNVEYD